MGLFALVSGKTAAMGSQNRSGFLMQVFFLAGLANHIFWNSFAVGLGFLGFLLDVFLIFPLFTIVLRDFLGGHFNFQNFLEPLETPLAYPEVPPPPPPPPYLQQSTVSREVPKEEGVVVKVRCSYCGMIYEEALGRCPNCGAKN
jgi:hypothetical protein